MHRFKLYKIFSFSLMSAFFVLLGESRSLKASSYLPSEARLLGEGYYRRANELFQAGNLEKALEVSLKAVCLRYDPAIPLYEALRQKNANEYFVIAKEYRELGILSKAIKAYEEAAFLGKAEALNELGVLFLGMENVKQDLPYAFKCFTAAAAVGDKLALHNLGWMYENGRGVGKDLSKALNFYLAATKLDALQSRQVLNVYFPASPTSGGSLSRYDEEIKKLKESIERVKYNQIMALTYVRGKIWPLEEAFTILTNYLALISNPLENLAQTEFMIPLGKEVHAALRKQESTKNSYFSFENAHPENAHSLTILLSKQTQEILNEAFERIKDAYTPLLLSPGEASLIFEREEQIKAWDSHCSQNIEDINTFITIIKGISWLVEEGSPVRLSRFRKAYGLDERQDEKKM